MIKNGKYDLLSCSVLFCIINTLGCNCCDKCNGGGGDPDSSGDGDKGAKNPQKQHTEWGFKAAKNLQARKNIVATLKESCIYVVCERHESWAGVELKNCTGFEINENATLKDFYDTLWGKNCNPGLKNLLYLYLGGNKDNSYCDGLACSLDGSKTLKELVEEFADSEDGILYISYLFLVIDN